MSELNLFEYLIMNNPVRRAVQRDYEFPRFLAMLDDSGIDLAGKRILDAGCGSGYGCELIRDELRPVKLVGIDLMESQLDRARRRRLEGVDLKRGDLTNTGEPDGSFDAIFVFGILHHIPAWRTVLCVFARVLAPDGVLLIEEIHGTAVRIQDRLIGTSHPRSAAFNWPEFRDGLRNAGFNILDERPLAGSAAHSFLARK